MKKLKIYLDTSVISHLDQQDAKEGWEEATHKLWNEIQLGRFEPYISEIVFSEIDDANKEKREIMIRYLEVIDYKELNLTEEIKELAEKYIAEGIIPETYRDDARHIAIATVNNCDVIASWNFKHMVKMNTIIKVNRN